MVIDSLADTRSASSEMFKTEDKKGKENLPITLNCSQGTCIGMVKLLTKFES
jgi:hypothetical protein